MAHHEEKSCPCCNARFECKMGSITLCQCTSVELNKEEWEHISSSYEDCLCAECLKTLKSEHRNINNP